MRALASIPANYKVLFLQGGASLQFSMVPLNLLTAGTHRRLHHHRDRGPTRPPRKPRRSAASTSRRPPRPTTSAASRRRRSWTLTPDAAYVHITSNNTIEGTQWHALPDVGGAPLVSDASSDLFCRPIDISKYGLIYAGAQKNLGPSGATLVIIREDLLARSAKSLHTMLNYAVHAENGSLYNTPPCFAIYSSGLVMRWLRDRGGLEAIGAVNQRKAGKLYAELDRTGFWRPTARTADRSLMNVTFRLRHARSSRSSS